MTQFTFVPVLSGGHPLPDVVVIAETYRQGHDMAWKTLTPEQQDNLEYLDFVDQKKA